jgi:DNA-binding NarL/FixJ family response regulator
MVAIAIFSADPAMRQSLEQLLREAFVIFVDGADEEDSLDALYAGARAILPRTAKPDEIFTAIKAVTNGLAVLPGEFLPTLLSGASLVGELLDDNDADRARLTPP